MSHVAVHVDGYVAVHVDRAALPVSHAGHLPFLAGHRQGCSVWGRASASMMGHRWRGRREVTLDFIAVLGFYRGG